MVTGHLTTALNVCIQFHPRDHTQLPKEGRAKPNQQQVQEAEEAFNKSAGYFTKFEIQRLSCVQKMGKCLTVVIIIINGTELCYQERCNVVFIWYRINPPDLLHHFYGCEVGFSITHALNYKNGFLFTDRHNDIRERVP